MKTVKVLVIDAKNREVTEREIENKLHSFYGVIGCELVEAVYLRDGKHFMYVDEEGLMKMPQDFFLYEGAHQPIAGNAIVLTEGRNGDNANVKLTAKEVESKLTWMTLDEVRRWAQGVKQ
jgi:hypothetical protein